jgi:intracellular multiplication protein IcmL
MSTPNLADLTAPSQVAKLVRVTFLVAVIALVTSITSFVGVYLAFTKKPIVIAATDQGRIIEAVPLNKPYVTDSRVLSYAEECTRRSFSHDFVNFRMTLAEASRCFSSQGVKQYQESMDAMLKELREKRMIMSTSVDPPVVVTTAEIDGRATWVVQAKIKLFREGQRERVTPQSYVVTMRIIRVDLEENVRGIAINEFNAKPVSE